MPRAVVLGCAGPTLSDDERAFFADQDPLGFIVFQRNCETPDQVRALVEALRASVGRPDAPILIDQEGGRVARLKPPYWQALPPAGAVGTLAIQDPDAAREAAWSLGRLLAADLQPLGITVDCAPVLDLPIEGSDAVIGDRAFGFDPERVATLGRALAEGLLAGGVLPVIKHIPGHGRATADSHKALPRVEAELETLERSDFRPFAALADLPLGMTAHILFTALDPERPVTTSPGVVAEVIRGRLGFDGLLFSDDLSMAALSGDLGQRTAESLAAGCDVALHCNGDPEEMAQVCAAAGPLSEAAARRWEAARARIAAIPRPIDAAALRSRLDALLLAQ